MVLLTGAVASTLGAPLFIGKDGLVVVEAESTSSSKGRWKEKQMVPGYTGGCHLEFTGNKPTGGEPASTLKYYFTVDKDGVYRLYLRAHKRLKDDQGRKAASDHCNDCYVRLKGDYYTGGDTPTDQLEDDTKLFVHGKSDEGFDWASMLDYHHKKTAPVYRLKKGETYTLYVSGRSQRFNFDRFVFMHESVNKQAALDRKTPESKSTKK